MIQTGNIVSRGQFHDLATVIATFEHKGRDYAVVESDAHSLLSVIPAEKLTVVLDSRAVELDAESTPDNPIATNKFSGLRGKR